VWPLLIPFYFAGGAEPLIHPKVSKDGNLLISAGFAENFKLFSNDSYFQAYYRQRQNYDSGGAGTARELQAATDGGMIATA
jgi:hypothetical protein